MQNSKNIKICAGIVTYNPELELLRTNVLRIFKQVNRVFICDNGSQNIKDIEQLSTTLPNVNIIHIPENKGIAYALNQLCSSAKEHGFNWILTLDQDSVSPANLIAVLSKYVTDDIAVVSPDILYRGNENYMEKRNCGCVDVQWSITSASLTNLRVWSCIAGFDSNLFIDYVDYDFCIRARFAGFRVIRVNEISLIHELGNMECRRVFGRVVHVTNHSAFRCYYMSRNAIICKHKLNMGTPVSDIFKLVTKVLFYEDNKISKLCSILKGIRDARRYVANKLC